METIDISICGWLLWFASAMFMACYLIFPVLSVQVEKHYLPILETTIQNDFCIDLPENLTACT